jgi:hypothetical protein
MRMNWHALGAISLIVAFWAVVGLVLWAIT